MAGDPRRYDDLFLFFGRIAIKRLFGGEGIFAGPLMIGLVMRDQLYLRTDAQSLPRYLAEKSAPFSFAKGGKTVSTAYYSVPDRLLDDPEELADWARDAERVARARAARTRR
jgi:DNA transformation protein